MCLCFFNPGPHEERAADEGDASLDVVSCPAPFLVGGLGRHLAEVVTQLRESGHRVEYFATNCPPSGADGNAVRMPWLPWIMRYTPIRLRGDWKADVGLRTFDRAVARKLFPGRVLHAFAGAALRTFRRARALGFAELHLESPTAHVRHARRMYDLAYRAHPVERDWLGERTLSRTLAEYELADVIWVNSEYCRETFLAQGVPAGKLRKRRLTVDPRYVPRVGSPDHTGLHVVYVGSLAVSKGIPLLLDAFARYRDPDARLSLVGGSGSRGMRRFLEDAIARDPRIRAAPGDPLPSLSAADVYVHPSYQDGFGYAPMEALACKVPVIVTADTGMKEHVLEGQNGLIVPTGNADAILDRLEHIRRHPPRHRQLGAGIVSDSG